VVEGVWLLQRDAHGVLLWCRRCKDAFNVSQAIPTRIGLAFFGAINSSLLPYLIHLRNQEGEEAFWKAYSSIYRWLVTLLLLFTALMMIAPQPFIAILAPGFYNDPQRLSLTVFFIRFTALIFLFQVAFFHGK